MILEQFKTAIKDTADAGELAQTLIGEGVMIPGLNGDVPLVYADYVASGRAMRPVEAFISEKLLPFYANSHTEASYCGQYVTRLRRDGGRLRGDLCRLRCHRGSKPVGEAFGDRGGHAPGGVYRPL